MSTEELPPGRETRNGLSTIGKGLLFVALPVVVVGLIVTAVVLTNQAFSGASVDETAEVAAGTNVSVDTPNAELRFSPSDDDQVRVTMTGGHTGPEPTIDVGTSNDVTTISGGCPNGWAFFTRCDITITIALPADLDLTVSGTNGAITMTDLDGDVDLTTTNGRIEASGTSGALSLETTNGAIEVRNARSTDVVASTSNGHVRLEFSRAPETVDASSTNGSIDIRVPDDGESYYIEADTTNGNVETDAVPRDRDANRTITASTTNGGITVERSAVD